MSLHSFNYNYNEKKIHVTASNCNIKVKVFDVVVNELVYQCTHDVKDKTTIWVQLNRKWHSYYIIKIFINNEIEYIEKTTIKGKIVKVSLESKALGDTLAWFPYVLDFQKYYGCFVKVSTFHNHLFTKYENPLLSLITPDDTSYFDVHYKIGTYENESLDPHNFRTKPLQKCAADILDVPYREKHCDLRHLVGKRPIKEPYVVIATSSTMKCKEWQYRNGWQEVVNYLIEQGYKVIQIPRKRIGIGVDPVVKLKGVENIDVDPDIINGPINWIGHCEFFIGLGSALSWLARSLNKKVIMISGFSDSFIEFKSNNIRVINKKGCHGCYNDYKVPFDRHWNWCPHNKSFECTINISPTDVIKAIETPLPEPKRKLMCVLPHCSTGGLPQYFLEKLKILKDYFDTYVVEWRFHGAEYSTQRNQIRELCTEFIELGFRFQKDFSSIVEDILPEIIHFEELPTELLNFHHIEKVHKLDRQKIIFTSHTSRKCELWKADKYVFPTSYQLELYNLKESKTNVVIEYPIKQGHGCYLDTEKNVLCIGIISPHKNQKYVVELAKLIPDTNFHFIGGFAQNFSDYWKPLMKNVPNNCTFYGEKGPEFIDEIYRKCTTLIHPSTIELLPLVFNEAKSYGLNILVNYLPSYDYYSSKKELHKLTMKIEEDVKILENILSLSRTIIKGTEVEFKEKVLKIYE
jgi:autotransporter strand-loop-strand O-heptosyltransferase